MGDLIEIIQEASKYDAHIGSDSPCYYCELMHPNKCLYCIHSKNREGLEQLQKDKAELVAAIDKHNEIFGGTMYEVVINSIGEEDD